MLLWYFFCERTTDCLADEKKNLELCHSWGFLLVFFLWLHSFQLLQTMTKIRASVSDGVSIMPLNSLFELGVLLLFPS